MPFTPFHFGPAAAIKAAAPRHFSFTVFCFAQCVIDAEVLFYMAQGKSAFHGYLHTYVGAFGVGLFSVVAGRPVCQKILAWWHRSPDVPLKEYFNPAPQISRLAAVTGAFVGSFSHVLLDSLMHSDLMPLLPISKDNGLLGALGPGALHGLCFLLGIIGLWLCARWRRKDL